MTTERDGAVGNLRDFRVSTQVGAALAEAGVLGPAARHAQVAFLADARIEIAEDGSLSTTLDDVPQKDLATAAAKYLIANPHFKQAAPGGSGVQTPTGGTLNPGDSENMSVDELANAGWNQRRPGTSGGKDMFDD